MRWEDVVPVELMMWVERWDRTVSARRTLPYCQTLAGVPTLFIGLDPMPLLTLLIAVPYLPALHALLRCRYRPAPWCSTGSTQVGRSHACVRERLPTWLVVVVG